MRLLFFVAAALAACPALADDQVNCDSAESYVKFSAIAGNVFREVSITCLASLAEPESSKSELCKLFTAAILEDGGVILENSDLIEGNRSSTSPFETKNNPAEFLDWLDGQCPGRNLMGLYIATN